MPACSQTTRFKKTDFVRHDDVKGYTGFTVHPKSAIEIG